ncbi:hypothetical protein M0R45_023367 [Rubus argutus]|uniref:RRM domain-containing protein n=1 Tax=Rubus argutus TaxID=59490 RepID=A0AAW1WQ52_RUBAR
MAFLSKFGNILRQTANKQIKSELSPFKPSILQAIRCMSTGPSSKLFVGGVSFQTDEQSLKEEFSKYGEVLDARIITDRETGRSRGFGFITFNSSEEASSAIQALDGQELHGRRVRVNYATDRPRANFGGGGYGGDGGYSRGGGGYGGDGGYSRGGGGYGGGGYGGDSYGSGNTGGGYGGSGVGNNSSGNYATGNTFDNSATGGFGSFGSPGGVGGTENSFPTGGNQFGDDKSGFNLDEPLEGNNRDDDDTADFEKRA